MLVRKRQRKRQRKAGRKGRGKREIRGDRRKKK
jgi:hypothetical protein